MGAAEILLSRKALVSNFKALQKSAPGLAIFPVIKANGYGHGASLIAKELEKEFGEKELPMFCVAQFNEALELRKAGIERRILILSYFEAQEVFRSRELNFSFVLSSERDIQQVLAGKPQELASSRVHLNFNTGMNRLGLSARDFLKNSAFQNELSNIISSACEVEGLMSHLARSEENLSLFTEKQENEFGDCLEKLKELFEKQKKIWPNWIHISNSASIHRGLLKGLATAARPGLRLLGAFQDESEWKQVDAQSQSTFLPVLSLRAPIRSLRDLEIGDGVGYGHKFVATRKTLLATICLGYADGIRRALGARNTKNPPAFFVEQVNTPIAGNVSMDMVMLDLTDHPDALSIRKKFNSGELVYAHWIGGGQRVEEIAHQANTISYEIFCALNQRIHRKFEES